MEIVGQGDWDWDWANALTWVYMVVPISSEGLSSSGHHRHDVLNTCTFFFVDVTFSLSTLTSMVLSEQHIWIYIIMHTHKQHVPHILHTFSMGVGYDMG